MNPFICLGVSLVRLYWQRASEAGRAALSCGIPGADRSWCASGWMRAEPIRPGEELPPQLQARRIRGGRPRSRTPRNSATGIRWRDAGRRGPPWVTTCPSLRRMRIRAGQGLDLLTQPPAGADNSISNVTQARWQMSEPVGVAILTPMPLEFRAVHAHLRGSRRIWHPAGTAAEVAESVNLIEAPSGGFY
jgi:hypothetical protein